MIPLDQKIQSFFTDYCIITTLSRFFCTNVKIPLCNIKVKTPSYPVFFLNACYTSYWLKLCEKWTQACMKSSFCVCQE